MDITDGVKTTGLCQYYLGFLRHSLKLGLEHQATALTDLDSKVFEAILRLLLILLTLLLNCAIMVTLYTKALSLVSVAAEPYEHSL